MSITVDALPTDDEKTVVDIEVLVAEIDEFLESISVNAHYEVGLKPNGILLSEINAFPDAQTRQNYEGIDELKESIKSSNLFHPLMVAKLNPQDASDYLDGLNGLWGTSHTIDEQIPTSDGYYYVLIAGHRRMKAVGLLLDEISVLRPDVDTSQMRISANVLENITLTDALKIQISENTSQKLPPDQEAHSIRLYKDRTGLNTRECANDLGCSQRKVRESVRFTEMPIDIQNCTKDGRLNYSQVVTLWHLQNAYRRVVDLDGRRRYSDDSEVTKELLIVVSNAIKNRWSTALFNNHVKAKITAITGGQEVLFTGFTDTPEKRLEDVLKTLGTIGSIEFAHIMELVEHKWVADPSKIIDKEAAIKNIKEALQRLERFLQSIGNISVGELVENELLAPQDTSLFQV